MTESVYKYTMWCETDGKWESGWFESLNDVVCPTNSSHTINVDTIYLLDEVTSQAVTVKEEYVKTGGNFQATTMKIVAPANQTVYSQISWPYNISPISSAFISTADHVGDIINMTVGKNTPIGVNLAELTVAPDWVSGNYIVNDRVVYNGKVYSCILNTVSNEIPTNNVYWNAGYYIPVNDTVSNNTMNGYHITITGQDLGRVIKVLPNKIWVENNISTTIAVNNYLLQTIYFIKNYEVSFAGLKTFGASKIIASYLPANVIVEIEYINNSNIEKTILGQVEYLY